uniref:BREX-1 system adenine-specific DNA-methyltransferase PglX n=1 Tax=Salinibacter altiplanensis TaxID=1803181 RepID=UPI00131A559D
MDTSGLESFAQDLRTKLLGGVKQRLRYWGFEEDGSIEEAPEEIEGGYIFRGEVHGDPGVPKKWRALKNAVNQHDVDHVAEEAAYTWFNRLVALRILEKNGYVPDTLGYAEDTTQPAVLYRARQGVIDVLDGEGEQDVREALLESDDDRAFRQLLIGVCHDNDLLSDVFGRINDYTELLLPTGLLQPEGAVERLVTTGVISDEDFEQVELIGWLYQFYISEKKDVVYDQSGKFQPEDIPAATQIFTPRWIVRYMVENTIGKQWLEKYPDSPLREEMEYLVENEDDDSDSTEPIFDDLSELELFDPAAGSGHILVVGFDLLMQMYRERGFTDREAVKQILTENLKGLEIDRRAAQLARFALLMKAAQYDRQALDRDDLRPEVYAMPEPRDFSTSDLRAYFGDDVSDVHSTKIKEALDLIKEHGQNVGSALKLDLSDDARTAVTQRVADWEKKTRNGTVRLDEQELHTELRGYLRPLLLLTGNYPAVATNPPYASSRNINKPLKNYLKEHYPQTKKDLFATFMEVLPDHTRQRGRFAFITPPSWMFLSSYEDLRVHYIENYFFDSLLQLSRGIFGADFGSVATAVQKAKHRGRTGRYFRLVERTFQEFHARHLHELFRRVIQNPEFRYDFSEYEKDGSIPNVSNPEGKRLHYPGVDQQDFEKIPGATIAYWVTQSMIDAFHSEALLGEVAEVKHGMTTGNNKRFLRTWYELYVDSIG